MTNEKQFDANKRQIAKSVTNVKNPQSGNFIFRLIDAVDNIDTLHKDKGTYNKKVLINVNSAKDGGNHSQKQVSFFWDIDELLLVAHDIVEGKFKDTLYPSAKSPGAYSKYGGGQYSRILNVKFENGKYMFQIALFKAIVTKNGAVMPDKNNPVDAHSIQLTEFEARKFMNTIKTHIETKLVTLHTSGKLLGDSGEETFTPEETVQAPEPQAQPEPQPVSQDEGDDLFGSFGGLFG